MKKPANSVVKEFEDLCREAFQSLEQEFDLRATDSSTTGDSATVILINRTTAVEVYLEVRDSLVVYTTLAEYDTDLTNRFPLESLIDLRNPSLRVRQPREWPLSEDRIRQTLRGYARALRECAADVLRGDFQVFPELGRLMAAAIQQTREENWKLSPANPDFAAELERQIARATGKASGESEKPRRRKP
jgi:hypothetical protein